VEEIFWEEQSSVGIPEKNRRRSPEGRRGKWQQRIWETGGGAEGKKIFGQTKKSKERKGEGTQEVQRKERKEKKKKREGGRGGEGTQT